MYINNSMQYTGIPMDFYGYNGNVANPPIQQNNQYQYAQPGINMQPQKKVVDPRIFDTPKIVMDDQSSDTVALDFTASGKGSSIKIDNTPDMAAQYPAEPAKRGRKKKEITHVNTETLSDKPVTQVSGTVEETPTSYSYMETTGLLKETLYQIDTINSELMNEFEDVRSNRTLKNKYMMLVGLSQNIGSLIGNRIQAIKEINNSIAKSNDLDYKKYKDFKAAQSNMTDDKYIADVYQSMINNPANLPNQPNMQMPNPSLYSSGVIRASILPDSANASNPADYGYMNYVSNLSPEQNLMRFENDPNVKQVIVYDASNGSRFFQYMNLATGEVINNMPVYTEQIMEDTTLDIKNKIGKNININETFPIIVINDNITSQY